MGFPAHSRGSFFHLNKALFVVCSFVKYLLADFYLLHCPPACLPIESKGGKFFFASYICLYILGLLLNKLHIFSTYLCKPNVKDNYVM